MMTKLPRLLMQASESLLSSADSALLIMLGHDVLHRRYLNTLHRASEVLGGGPPQTHALSNIAATNNKVGPLLTHVSIMIAVLAVLIGTPGFGSLKRAIFAVEIGAYLFIAIICLRCIDNSSKDLTELPGELQSNTELREEIIEESIVKNAWFAVANRGTIVLTIVLLISTPIVLLA